MPIWSPGRHIPVLFSSISSKYCFNVPKEFANIFRRSLFQAFGQDKENYECNLTRKRNAMKSIITEKNWESSPFWNPESTELESGIQYSESGIHRVGSRIQDCHGFPYMGRLFIHVLKLPLIDWMVQRTSLMNPEVPPKC